MPPKGKVAVAGGSLPTKERALFTRLLQEYETKKYRLGLKTADAILKKHPEHGETLCMKGLILASLGDRAAGLDLARQGVRKDLTSFISWHALGILNRMDKNYEESIKCYAQALRIEGGTNLNLIRESSYMHVQSRNFTPLIDQRVTLLRMQPHIRSNWAALATAYHLDGQLKEAENVLAQWENTCRDVPTSNYEHSEMLLYKASILFEDKRYEDVITYFSHISTSSRIVDQRAMRLLQAKSHLELGQLDEAQKMWTKLVQENEEDRGHIQGWLRSKGVKLDASSDAEYATAVEALRELRSSFPKSHSAQRTELVYLKGDSFAEALEAYLYRALTKGVPSIFSDLKALLADSQKQKALETVALSLLDKFAPSTSSDEPPSSYLWTLYFLAQFYSHTGQAETAIAYIESAIAHTPTLPELYMTKARILKRAGAVEAASHAMEDARLLDGQDRFLNSKDAKYKLRNGQAEEAEAVMGLFTKPDASSPLADLIEMQAIWFIHENGLSHEEQGDLHLALKRYAQTEKIFEDHWDDQLDFHSYCIRKFTLRDYIDMCRWEDGIRGHRTYVSAALRAVGIYLSLHDEPSLATPGRSATNGEAGHSNGTSEEETKKEQKRLKKLEAKKKEEEEAKKKKEAAAKAKVKGGKAAEEDDTPQVIPDPDPEGMALLQSKQPLEQAERLLRSLQFHASGDARVWIATFEHALRDKKWLLCARALRKSTGLLGKSSSSKDTTLAGRVHVQLLQLLKGMPDLADAPAEVRGGLEAALEGLRPSAEVSLERVNDEYLQRTGDVLSHARAALILSPASDATTRERVLASCIGYASDPSSTLPALGEVYRFLLSSSSPAASSSPASVPLLPRLSPAASSEELQAFRSKAVERFPLAEHFMGAEAREGKRREREERRRDWEAVKDGMDGVPA